MKVIGRYVVMAVLGMSVAACGGKSDPSDNVEVDSYILANFFGTTDAAMPEVPEPSTDDTISTSTSAALETKGGAAYFFRDGVQTQEEAFSIQLTQYVGVPLTGEDGSQPVPLMDLTQFLESSELSFPKYVNNSLSPIGFSLNDGQLTYGFDISIFSINGEGVVSETPDWRFSEMLNWCIITFNDDVASEADIIALNNVPSTLGAAESWLFGSDSRRQLCPRDVRYTLVMTWLGRDMVDVQDAIEAKIAELDKAFDEYTSDDYEEIRQAVLMVESSVPDGTSSYQLWYEISINEFQFADPYVIDVTVETVDYEEPTPETE